MAKALIFGVTGQDGSYLSKLLLGKGYEVIGTSRNVGTENLARLRSQDLNGAVRVIACDLGHFDAVASVINEIQPDEIYNLGGQSSVGQSFTLPRESFRSIVDTASNILEAVRTRSPQSKVYNACSSECFGNTDVAANEKTPFRPKSPYGTAKLAAFWLVQTYRASYGLQACNGILFNHESPLRPRHFVSAKIVRGALAIRDGRADRLELGNVEAVRDWGWAPDYVHAMWRMLQGDADRDYVVATGAGHSIKDFVERVFRIVGLDWRDHVTIGKTLMRPDDIVVSIGDSSLVQSELGWSPSYDFDGMIAALVDGVDRIEGLSLTGGPNL